jgi:hypothetical protein
MLTHTHKKQLLFSQIIFKLHYIVEAVHAPAVQNNSHNTTNKCTTVKLQFLHIICHNFEMFPSMELLNITKAYTKIHKGFLNALPMLSNFLKIIKVARNISKLRQSLCKN